MRPDLEVADVFHRHGVDYRRDHAGHLGRVERRVMAAVEACRTAALGGHAEHCTDCGLVRQAYNSCRNRHRPKCQGLARAQWLAERQAELLPVPYFHVVFTVPAQIAEIAFQNKAVVYAILFKAASEALSVAAADPTHLGAEIGMVAVLHTWGQNLHHHSHVAPVQAAIPRAPAGRLRRRPASLLQRSRQPGRPCHFLRPTGWTEADRMGRLRQAPRSAVPNRSSPIWAATPIASPSPTAAS